MEREDQHCPGNQRDYPNDGAGKERQRQAAPK